MTRDRISELETRSIEFSQSEQQQGKRLEKKMKSLKDLWDNNQSFNTHIIGIPEEGEEGGEGRSRGKITKEWRLSSLLDLKKVFKEIITENLPNLAKLYRQK